MMRSAIGSYLLLALVPTYACALEVWSVETDDFPDLQRFRLDQPGDHVFHFRPIEKGEMTLLLEVQGIVRGERERQELSHLGLTIEVALVNHKGHMVCHAVGSPKDGVSSDNWVVRAGHGEAAFWHKGCGEIKLKRSRYTLTVRLRDVDTNMPPNQSHSHF